MCHSEFRRIKEDFFAGTFGKPGPTLPVITVVVAKSHEGGE